MLFTHWSLSGFGLIRTLLVIAVFVGISEGAPAQQQNNQPKPIDMLRAVAAARMEVTSGRLAFDSQRFDNHDPASKPLTTSKSGEFFLLFKHNNRKVIGTSHKTTGVINGDDAIFFDGKSSVVIDSPTKENGNYLFDPRILGIAWFLKRGASVTDRLRINDAKNLQLIGREKIGKHNCWHIRFSDSYKQQHDYWIEDAKGFPVHQYEYQTQLKRVVTKSIYGGPEPTIPSEVVTKEWIRGQPRDMTRIKITNAEFGIDISDNAFELIGMNLPSGVEVTDLRISRRIGYWTGKDLADRPPRKAR